MNKIAISLALATVCIGIVTANKHVSQNQHSEESQSEVTSSHHHPSKYEVISCEEECNYFCRPRYHHGHGHGHGPGHGHGHGHGHGQGQGHGHGHGQGHGHGHGNGNGHKHRHGKGHGPHNSEGGKGQQHPGKQIDFYPGHYRHPFYEEPFYHHGSEPEFYPGHKHSGGEQPEHRGPPFQIKKHKGKRGGSRKGGNESGAKSGNKKSEAHPVEGHGSSVDAELDTIRADFNHRNEDVSDVSQSEKVKNNDLTFIRDKSSEAELVNQAHNAHQDSDNVNVAAEHAHVFAQSDK